MTDWPSSLPQFFERSGFQDEVPDNRIETAMEYGPPKRRRRTTSAAAPLSGTMVVTSAQWATLKSFYADDLEEVGSFNFPDPDGGSDLVVKFSKPPTRTAHTTPGRWRAVIALEKQP